MELNEFQFNSMRRKSKPIHNNSNQQYTNSRNRKPKTFSASNLSCISCSSTNNNSVGRKTLCLTVPEDFGAEIGVDGKVLNISREGPAHASGVLQIGDYVRVVDNEQEIDDYIDENGMISLHVTYAVLQIEQRPDCPFVIELGNRSRTSLGLALSDTLGKQIRISSIQPGSLADRCGYLKPGDILTAINLSRNETIPCSPCYNSFQIAKFLKNITTNHDTVSFTILPRHKHRISLDSEDLSKNSGSRLTKLLPMDPIDMSTFRNSTTSLLSKENHSILNFTMWKDGLYEDFGFSLVDASSDDSEGNGLEQDIFNIKGTLVQQIRPGGPAFLAGLQANDRILQINERDVSDLESTMLVPILASLEDGLNLTVLRENSLNTNTKANS